MVKSWDIPDRRAPVLVNPWLPSLVALTVVASVAVALYRSVHWSVLLLLAAIALAGWMLIARQFRPPGERLKGSWFRITVRTLIVTACTATLSIIPAVAGLTVPFTVERAPTLVVAFGVSAANAGWTALVEECINASVIVAAAALAHRFRPQLSLKQVAIIAISAGALVRLGLHQPLWGLGFGLSKLPYCIAMAVLFWYTRAVWPLILAHFFWDFGPLLASLSPNLALANGVALIFVLLLLTGLGFGITLAIRYWSRDRVGVREIPPERI